MKHILGLLYSVLPFRLNMVVLITVLRLLRSFQCFIFGIGNKWGRDAQLHVDERIWRISLLFSHN